MIFPDFYKGGYPDSEDVLRCLLKPFLDQCTPVPEIVGWLPDEYGEQLPIVTIFRGGGSEDGSIDRALIQVWCVCKTRSESNQLLEFCRQLVKCYKNGGRVKMSDGSHVAVTSTSEQIGPELVPEAAFDQRVVFATFCLETKSAKPIGVNYQGAVESIHA